MLPQSGNGCAQWGANGPGSLSSDSPRPWPNSPPSAWANSDCWIWPAPHRLAVPGVEPDVAPGRRRARSACSHQQGADEEEGEARDHVREARRGDVEQRQEGAEEHQRAPEVADVDEHQHRRTPDDEQRAEVLQRRDRQPRDAAGCDREQLPLLVQVAGEEDDDADLGDLGRLEGERPEVDVEVGAVDLRPDARQPRRQQQQDARRWRSGSGSARARGSRERGGSSRASRHGSGDEDRRLLQGQACR